MQAQLNAAISMINGYLWDYLIIFILIGAGLYFTFTTKFVQIRYLGEMIRLIASSAGEKNRKKSYFFIPSILRNDCISCRCW